jgi:hypothetical protein
MEQQTIDINEVRQRIEKALAHFKDFPPLLAVPSCVMFGHRRAEQDFAVVIGDVCMGCGLPWAELYPPTPKT